MVTVMCCMNLPHVTKDAMQTSSDMGALGHKSIFTKPVIVQIELLDMACCPKLYFLIAKSVPVQTCPFDSALLISMSLAASYDGNKETSCMQKSRL